MPEQIFIVLGKAVVAKGHEKYAPGDRHAVLAYAKATSHNEAEAIAMQELDKLKLVYFEAAQIGIVEPEQLDRMIAHQIDAHGFHATIYTGIAVMDTV